MKDQDRAEAAMLRRDCALLLIFLAAALGIVGFVLSQALAVTEAAALRALLAGVCGLSMLVLAGGMLWVLRHLRRNRREVYGEDLYWQAALKKQKEDAK